MSIVYKCSHCDCMVGMISGGDVDAAALGFMNLSAADMQQMIAYLPNGNIRIKTICETCESALAMNPEYHALTTFIQ